MFKAQYASMETSLERPSRDSKMRRLLRTKLRPVQYTMQHSESFHLLFRDAWWVGGSTVPRHWVVPLMHCFHDGRPLDVSWLTTARGALQPIQTKGHLQALHTN